jgi:elongation factor Ts
MAFTAKDVQALRERTGCGMMDCKKALTEANGDMEKAVEVLREKGLAAAAKKAGRIASEGVVLADVEDGIGIIIEVNAETDFVAKNEKFQEFVKNTATVVRTQNPADVEALLDLKYDDKFTVGEELRDKILTIGENMSIRRFERIEGAVVSYVHGGGRIGVLVQFETDGETAKNQLFEEIGKDVAMQIAALNPAYLSRETVPSEVIEKEKEILMAQIKNDPKMANKPDQIVAKMVEGRIGKFYENNCLVDQPFVKDGSLTVAQYVASKAKEIGKDISIIKFIRFERGEGMQKKEENFAEEIAKIVK